MSDIDLKKYQEFVDAVTSQESKNNNDFQTRWTILQNQRDANMPRLLTAALGLAAESGEFTEIIKKIIESRNFVQAGCFAFLLINFIPILPSGSFFNNFNITLFMINLSLLYALNKETNIFSKR